MPSHIQRLIEIMARLRDPASGCPWDLEQTFKTIAPHTIEETYELIEAIENGDPQAIKDELGDVLLQIVFYAQMASEAKMFDFEDIAGHLADKLIERHPHIFGERKAKTAHDVLGIWEKGKEAKRAEKAGNEGRSASVMDGVTSSLPASTRAVKLQKRAARVGFDWTDARDVFAKIREEIGELEIEIDARTDHSSCPVIPSPSPLRGAPPSPAMRERVPSACEAGEGKVAAKTNKSFIEDELGDVLFAVTNLARKLDIDPETALRSTNRKFERRFRQIEEILARQGKNVADASLPEMEQIWNEIKAEEKAAVKGKPSFDAPQNLQVPQAQPRTTAKQQEAERRKR
jgi:nucleoside triphosphate diphosphatase